MVDDDARLREVVRYGLERAGFLVSEAGDGLAALDWLSRNSVDLVVLDVLMPELDGLQVCKRLRAEGAQVPIVFLSTRNEEFDRVLGLDMGGDDYLAKPFSVRELVSRVRAVLRRTGQAEGTVEERPVQVGRLSLDNVRHQVSVDGTPVALTATEFRMLAALMERPGRVLPREELVDRTYGPRHFISDRTLDSHLRNIRHKLRAMGHDDIETVRGVGVRLREPGPA